MRLGGGHRGAAASDATFLMGASSGTPCTAMSTALRRTGGLLLETLDGGRGIYCCVGGEICIVACCGGIRSEHSHLLHQQLLLLMELCIVQGKLL